jgi:type I restriction enzyme S subunit
MDNIKKVPALRFPEFSGEWEEEKLEQLADITTGNKDTQNKVDEGIYPFFVRSQTVEKINSFSYDGEAILTSGDGVGVGKNFHYINGKFDYHQRVYCIFKFKNQVLGKYIYFYFSEKFNKRVMRMSAKNSVDSVRRDMVTKMPICIPILSEQKKVSDFLTQTNNKIEQLSKKKQLLESYKKGSMQKIFSQELRFKDDEGKDYPDWEEKKLVEIATFHRGANLSKSDLVDNGNTECVHYGELFTMYDEIIKSVTSSTNNKEGVKSKSGDILMPSSDVTPQGLGRASALMKDDVLLGGDINIVRSNKDIDSIFLSYLINYDKNKVIRLVTGTTVKHIYTKDLKTISINLPSLIEEQTKIANFLTEIDNKINLVEKQLSDTKKYKKGLLQQMFV